jgi:hypothetical protein
VALSTIKGEVRRVHSDVLRIGVTGPPLLLTEANRDLQYAGLQENKELQVSKKAVDLKEIHQSFGVKNAPDNFILEQYCGNPVFVLAQIFSVR